MRETPRGLTVLAVTAVCLGLTGGIAAGKKHHPVRAPRGTIVTRAVTWRDVAVQPDGKMVTVGFSRRGGAHMVVARRLEDGEIDPSFARPAIPFATPGGADLVEVQPDGRILVAGRVSSSASVFDPGNFALARLLPDGRLDPSFGSGGITQSDFGADDGPGALALEPDGRILLAGGAGASSKFSPVSHSDFAVARYEPNGAPDPTFGGGGRVTIPFGGFSTAAAITDLADGDIAVAGVHEPDPDNFFGQGQVAQVRLTSTGELDPSFGQAGSLSTPLFTAADARAKRVNLAGTSTVGYGADGRLVAAGSVGFERGRKHLNRTAVELLRTDGSRDPGFGSGGVSLLSDRRMGQPYALLLAPDGSMVVGGGAQRRAALQLVKLTPAGSLIRAFGNRGVVRTPTRGFFAVMFSLAADPAGRIVAVGWSELQEERPGLSMLARYSSSGKLDKRFGPRHKRRHRRHRRHRR